MSRGAASWRARHERSPKRPSTCGETADVSRASFDRLAGRRPGRRRESREIPRRQGVPERGRMRDALLSVYQGLPGPARSVAATVHGWYLTSWRYGPDAESLVEEALERETWSPE